MKKKEERLGLKYGWKLVLVLRTEKLGERERKALSPSQGRGHDADDDADAANDGDDDADAAANDGDDDADAATNDDDDDDDIWVVLGLAATIFLYAIQTLILTICLSLAG